MGKYIALLVVFLFFDGGCTLRRMKADVARLEEQLVLVVNVDIEREFQGQLVAVVYMAHAGEQRIAAFKVIDPRVKKNAFLLEPAAYRLAVFHDANSDLVIDESESVIMVERGHRLSFSDVRKRLEFRLDFPDEPDAMGGFPRDLSAVSPSMADDYKVSMGELFSPDAEPFSLESGSLGLWEPTKFLKKYGVGIFQTEPHAPDKTPILFVSGMAGSAVHWNYFFDRLDKDQFEVWYFLYPSGMRIADLGRALNGLVRTMQKKYDVEKIHIVAHSMGGLVAREFIVEHLAEQQPSIVDTFVAISTPWNGHAMAKRGVEALSTAVPAWHDLVPGNGFIQNVFGHPIKGGVSFYLVFGYDSEGGGDGTISLDSMLLMEAQEEAREMRAFTAGHVDILSKDTVFEYVESVLLRGDSRAPETPAAPLDAPPRATLQETPDAGL